MSATIGSLLSFLLLYKYAALAAIVVAGAALTPLPIAILLVAAGAFAAQGYLDVRLTLGVAVGANVAGDLAEYALARAYGARVLRALALDRSRWLGFVKAYLREHPARAIILTRFLGGAEAVANVFAGVARIDVRRFATYDVIGNVLSIAPYVALGYLAGAAWQSVVSTVDAGGWAIAAIVLAILGVGAYRSRSSRQPRAQGDAERQ